MSCAQFVVWTCDRCGTRGKIDYDAPTPRGWVQRDVATQHRIKLNDDFTRIDVDHLLSVHLRIYRGEETSRQLNLFQDGGAAS